MVSPFYSPERPAEVLIVRSLTAQFEDKTDKTGDNYKILPEVQPDSEVCHSKLSQLVIALGKRYCRGETAYFF